MERDTIDDMLFMLFLGMFIGGLLGIHMYRAGLFRELAMSLKQRLEQQNVAVPQQEGDSSGRIPDDSSLT